MDMFAQATLVGLLFSIAIIALTLLIFWLIVRAAVLSALRQYRAEAPKSRIDFLD
ncbi:MAG: hypothetical protein IR160_05290 [Salinibacterium sp.]|nr:hypothetical protein [Salinibacterium sp.]MBF0671982.1 hypothetical protein [Salinibacterium sp.]